MESKSWSTWSLRQFLEGAWAYFCAHAQMLSVFILTALITYGVKLFHGAVGVDTELALETGGTTTAWMIQLGRPFLTALHHAWGIGNADLYVMNFVAVILLVAAAMFWCYWWHVISDGRIGTLPLAFFGVYFISSGTWQEALYFTFIAPQFSFLALLLPIVLFLLFRGILQGGKASAFAGIFLLAMMTATYQAVTIYFISGVLATCVAFSLWGDETLRQGWRPYAALLAKLVLAFVAAMILYLAIKYLVIFAAGVQPSNYVVGQAGTHGKGLVHGILKTGSYAVLMIFGNCSFFDPVIYRFAKNGAEASMVYHDYFASVASIGYLPVLLAYGWILWKLDGHWFAKVVACVLPFVILIFPAAGGGTAVLRAQWAIPVVVGFLLLLVLQEMRGRWREVFVVVLALTCFFQVQHTAAENYAVQRVYEFDRTVAHDVDSELHRVLAESGDGASKEDVQVLYYGAPEPEFSGLFIPGGMSRHSIIAWDRTSKREGTGRGVAFLHAMGYAWHPVTKDTSEEELDALRSTAATMPSYPVPGYVQRQGNVLIVKFSNALYPPKE